MPADIDNMWLAYRQSKKDELRQQLVLHYLDLVRYVVGRVRGKLPPYLDKEDLASYGLLGLMDAIEKFDPSRGVKFETYAVMRIRGAILDALRKACGVPRSVTGKLRRVADAFSRLEQAGQNTTDEEVAREAGLTVEELQELWAQAGYLSTVSLEEFLLGMTEDDNLRKADTIPDHASPNPESAYVEAELKRDLAAAIEKLPEKDQLVLSLYYYEGLTLKEIGKVLGVSESRVCQLHARALVRLREKLKPYV